MTDLAGGLPQPVYIVGAGLAGLNNVLPVRLVETDTTGGAVPTWKAHSFTYDGSGNLATDTVTDGANTWVRTYMWSNGAPTTDSGWVKQ